MKTYRSPVILILDVVNLKKLFLKTVENLSNTINSYEFKITSRKKPQYFSRKGRLGFVNTILNTLNYNNKSQQIELDKFFKLTGSSESVTKQAFSKIRQQIDPNAFKQLFNETVYNAVESQGDLEKLRDYTPIAIDGSTISLENSYELLERFGHYGNGEKTCTARISIACNCLNGIIYDANIDSYKVGERKFAKSHIERISEIGVYNPLIIMDRGYFSDDILKQIENLGFRYIMRVKDRWHTKEIAKTENGAWANLSDGLTSRVIKLTLSSGEIETLFTNLAEFEISEFMELYALRWGVETKYAVVKNKLMLENFTGKTCVAIMQDFWATMMLSNLTSFLKIETDEAIGADNKGKGLKYEYQTNTNILIGKLKDNLVLMLLFDNEQTRQSIFDDIVSQIVKNRIPIRPNRHDPRTKHSRKRKFNSCTKGTL